MTSRQTSRQPPAGYTVAPCTHGDSRWEGVVRLRLRVYVDEQKVPLELELDEYDRSAWHLALLWQDTVVGTLRVVWEPDEVAHIGRLAIAADHRKKGLASVLIQRAIDEAINRGCRRAVLDAQTWITHLYAAFGFSVTGDEFLDAGIPHFRMVRLLKEVL